MDAKLKAAHKLLSQADEQFTDYRDKARLLASRRYTEQQANQYIDTLLPMPPKRKAGPSRFGNARSKRFARPFGRNVISFHRFVEAGGRYFRPQLRP